MNTFLSPRYLLLHLFLLFAISLFSLGAQNNSSLSDTQCKIGLEYQRFLASNGINKPIILTVEPHSPAALAGLKVGDFIESINGEKSSTLSDDEIQSLLSSSTPSSAGVALEVSNFGYSHSPRTLYPLCLSRRYLDESLLVDAFSFYSLEDASSRQIIYPFTTVGDGDTKYEDLLYFSFSPSATEATGSDNAAIVKILAESLRHKGLIADDARSQIVVDYYYSLEHNPYYKGKASNIKTRSTTLRYNFDKKQLIPYPLLDIGQEKTQAPYILTFGITLFDASRESYVLWHSEAVEFLTDELAIADYVAMAAPAMLLQFPLVRYNSNMHLRVVDKNYYYTGVMYDSNDMTRIAHVVKNSPSDEAGLQAGDYIIAINAKPMVSSSDLTRAYRLFVRESIYYRDESTIFTDLRGIKGCRYWDVKDYKKVQKLFEKKKFKTVFAYLFGFRPYIYGDLPKEKIFFDVHRAGEPHTFGVEPKLRICSYVTLD